MDTDEQNGSAATAEDRYRLLIDAITDYAIFMLDPDGCVTSWNRGAERCNGYREAEILGRHLSVFYTEQDRAEELPRRALETSAHEGGFENEGWRLRKDGSRFWAHAIIDPIRDNRNRLVGFAKITRDLTERKAAADALRQSEDQFRLLVQSVTEYAIYLLDSQGRVSSWNAGAQRIKGYLPGEVIGRHSSIFYTERDRDKGEPARSLDIAARAGRCETEGWRVRKDGSLFLADVATSPIRDAEGLIIGYAIVTRDMTGTRKVQFDLERARDALFQAQKMEAVGQLTGGVAHDFNNILMAILGGLEVVRRRLPEDPGVSPLLDNAIQSARRGQALTQRMLAFARRQDLKPEAVHLSDLLSGMQEFLQRSLGPSIAIEVHAPPTLSPVLVDPHQLEMAVLNLAMNSRDAMPDGGSIVIRAQGRDQGKSLAVDDNGPSADYVCLSVADLGDGMDEHTLSRAVEPFFTTKGVGKGTGLGLSMVHGFAEQSGGQFILHSREGEGTTAELWIPVAVDAVATAPMAEAAHAPPEDEALTVEASHPMIVLVVDDDRLVLMNTTLELNNLGHRVFTATTGEQAIKVIRSEAVIDLAIIDHQLPDLSGAQLAEAIRSEWPSLPIIFATPLADPSVQRVAKPFRRSDLVKAIARIQPADRLRSFNA